MSVKTRLGRLETRTNATAPTWAGYPRPEPATSAAEWAAYIAALYDTGLLTRDDDGWHGEDGPHAAAEIATLVNQGVLTCEFKDG